jgi:hypothetical protein
MARHSLVRGGNVPPRLRFAPLAVLSPGRRLAGTPSMGKRMLEVTQFKTSVSRSTARRLSVRRPHWSQACFERRVRDDWPVLAGFGRLFESLAGPTLRCRSRRHPAASRHSAWTYSAGSGSIEPPPAPGISNGSAIFRDVGTERNAQDGRDLTIVLILSRALASPRGRSVVVNPRGTRVPACRRRRGIKGPST